MHFPVSEFLNAESFGEVQSSKCYPLSRFPIRLMQDAKPYRTYILELKIPSFFKYIGLVP